MSTAKSQQKPQRRLGRGLSSLISVSEVPVEAEVRNPAATADGAAAAAASSVPATSTTPVEIPIDQIVPNPHQPRREFQAESLAELAASLKSTGLIQPVIVRSAGDRYELIAGERRMRAAKLAGLAALPAIIRDVDSFTQAQMALIENIQREDLNPIDRALGYRALIDQLGLTQAELAGRLGEERSSIANYLRLLDLAEPVRAMVADGRLTMGHAKLIAGTSDILEQERLANLVISQGLSVRNLERLLQERPAEPAARETKEQGTSAYIQDLEKSISRQLGMGVQVRSAKKGKGRLVIHYASLDQFDDILSRLGVQTD